MPCAATEVSKGDGFELRRRVVEPVANVSVGGGFTLAGFSADPLSGLKGADFALGRAREKALRQTGGCPCQAIFEDGFESGDLGAWNSSVGAVKKATEIQGE